ncbi:MAG TPA: hypothetical protein VKW04_08355 [Planctomycetota bacterium]|nr:hypothetical protein [Planctomycetota bacterium]
MKKFGQRKGAVLIIVLGVLAVLALLAVTFSTLQATERQIAHNYMDTVRAKLLAQSGVQDAEAKLREYFPGRYFNTLNVKAPKPWKYWGQDPTETIEPPVTDDIQYALNPSFAIEADPIKNVAENPQDPTDANVNPKKVSIEGKMCGLSGFQGGTYAVHGDQYVLRVNDTSGRLYVNDGVDGTPNGKMNTVSRNMRRILNVLGDVLQTANLGNRLIDNRPTQGYQSLQDVLKALNYDEALFNKVKNYITVYAWVDNNVVNPVPLNQQVASQFQSQTGVSYNRGTGRVYRAGSETQGVDSAGKPLTYGLDYMQSGSDVKRLEVRVFGLDALNPQHIEVVSRAPVNVNAAPVEVITALLTGLQGFFLTDRKRNNPRWEGDLYLAFKMQFKYYPEATSRGDEIGFLVDTFPIVNATGTGTQGISARILAQEIVACRNGDRGKYANYNPKTGGGKWFGGPFRSWHQFNAFIDFLARSTLDGGAGFLVDSRSGIFMDYEEEGVDPIGFGGLVASDLQRDYASQAIADVIKANFNPNCHLNELNPDANLFLIVDKTDLFINSTEFCFMPTGYFEVESLGRVLRPRSPKEHDAYLGDNEIAAQAKVTATMKIYDMYRESTQKQFYGGTLAPQSSQWGTNNDKSIEIGPEPDNGYFPGNLQNAGREMADNEWDGYLALPTMGGVFGGGHGSADKQPNTLARTMGLGKSGHLGSAFHVHFTLDHDAHDHPADPTEIGSQKPVPTMSETYNYGDYVKGAGILPYGGPYNPTKGQPGYHRLAKSFRLYTDPKTGTQSQVNLDPFAPSDLRIDGAYVERHSAPCYYNMKNGLGVWQFDTVIGQGMISFWWKPSFAPERTGKIRTLFDISRSHGNCGADVNVWPFALWFYPAQYNPGTSENTKPKYWHNNQGYFNPCSLVGGSKAWHDVPAIHEFGRMTGCLNHLGHADHKWSVPSPLQAHRWMNTSFLWNINGDDGSGEQACKIFLNGTEAYTKYNYSVMSGNISGHSRIYNFEKHDGGAYNHIRLGGSSFLCTAAKGYAPEDNSYRGNYTGDHTLDEFYAWNKPGDPLILWQGSRYYRPTGAGATGGAVASQGRFTSQALTTMVPYSQRVLAPPSNTPAPGGVVAVAGGTQTAEPPTLRVVGMSWTWYGELPDHRLTPWASWDGTRLLYDYNGAGAGEAGMPVANLNVKVGAGINDAGQIYGPYYDDGFSAILNNRSRTPTIQDPTKLKYFVQIEIPGGGKPILLASPVIDDVTLYWDDNQSHLLSYVFDNRSF